MSRLDRMRAHGSEAGYTLVELLVATTLFTLLVGLVSTTIASQSRAADSIHQLNDVNEEARLTLVRISRELHEAVSIDRATVYTAATAPAGHPEYATLGYASALTFSADFNGNGVIEPDAPEPEQLTYTYRQDATGSGNGQIELTATDGTGTPIVRPVLSAHVSDFHLELRSSLYRCDANSDGYATWQELDANPSGNGCQAGDHDGLLDSNELSRIDSVVVSFQVFEGSHRQTYSTQINLRNVGVQ